MQKRVVIAGSRYFNDYALFSAVVNKCLLKTLASFSFDCLFMPDRAIINIDKFELVRSSVWHGQKHAF